MDQLNLADSLAQAETLTAKLKRCVSSYLVCHDTQTKLYIGAGAHILEYDDFSDERMAEFLRDNCPYALTVEITRDENQAYKDYALPPFD